MNNFQKIILFPIKQALFLAVTGFFILFVLISAKPVAAASPDTLTAQQKQLRVIPTVGEQCNTLSEPGFFFGGKTEKATATTCDVKTTPFCDKENRACVQCLTPDKDGYDKSKTCGSEYACIKGRCVPLETPLPALTIKDCKDPNDPSTCETRQLEITGPASYILYLYNFGLRIAGVLAFLLIMFYGFLYITSAGNEKRLGEYKEKLGNVLVGIIVLLGSYIILQTINPTLTELREPQYRLKLPDYVGVCNKKGIIDLKPKDKVAADTKIYDKSLGGLACACQIWAVKWGLPGKDESNEIFKVGEDIPYTLYPMGCQEENSTPVTATVTTYRKDGSWFFNKDANMKSGWEEITVTGDEPKELSLKPDAAGTWYLYIKQSGAKIKLRNIQSPLIEVADK